MAEEFTDPSNIHGLVSEESASNHKLQAIKEDLEGEDIDMEMTFPKKADQISETSQIADEVTIDLSEEDSPSLGSGQSESTSERESDDLEGGEAEIPLEQDSNKGEYDEILRNSAIIKAQTETIINELQGGQENIDEILNEVERVREQIRNELAVEGTLESVFGKLPELVQKSVRKNYEEWYRDITGREKTENQDAPLLFEIDDVKQRLIQLYELEDRLLLTLAKNNLDIQNQEHTFEETDQAAIIFDPHTKSEYILALAKNLPHEMVQRLLSIGPDSEKGEKSALLEEIEDYLKRDFAERHFQPGKLDFRYEDISDQTNLTELVQRLGEQKDVDRILELLKKGRLVYTASGELTPRQGDQISENLYNHFVEEIIERAKVIQVEGIKGELAEAAEEDPMLIELKELIKEKKDRLRLLEEKFGFDAKKGFRARLYSKMHQSESYEGYLKHKSEMNDLPVEIRKLENMLEEYMEEKDQMLEEYAKGLVEAESGIKGFDSLDFDIENLAKAIAGARKGEALQTYKTPLAKVIISENELRPKMKKDGFKKPPKVMEIKEKNAVETVSEERKQYLAEKIREEIEISVNEKLDEREITDMAIRQKLINKVFTSDYFETYKRTFLVQDGLAQIINEKMTDGSQDKFVSRFLTNNLEKIHDLEIDKVRARNDILRYLDNSITGEKDSLLEKERTEFAKEVNKMRRYQLREYVYSDVDFNDDTEVSEIIQSGRGIRAASIRTAIAASNGISTLPDSIKLAYYGNAERRINTRLELVPDARDLLERQPEVIARKELLEEKLKVKKEQSPNWLLAIFGLG